jgi:hypothetical protein
MGKKFEILKPQEEIKVDQIFSPVIICGLNPNELAWAKLRNRV